MELKNRVALENKNIIHIINNDTKNKGITGKLGVKIILEALIYTDFKLNK